MEVAAYLVRRSHLEVVVEEVVQSFLVVALSVHQIRLLGAVEVEVARHL